MKTTIDLPDQMVKDLKRRALEEDRTLRDLVAELLHVGLTSERSPRVVNRVEFPLVECERADPADEVTPERLAAILTELDAHDVENVDDVDDVAERR